MKTGAKRKRFGREKRKILREIEIEIKRENKRVKEIETKQKDRISKFSLKNGTL